MSGARSSRALHKLLHEPSEGWRIDAAVELAVTGLSWRYGSRAFAIHDVRSVAPTVAALRNNPEAETSDDGPADGPKQAAWEDAHFGASVSHLRHQTASVEQWAEVDWQIPLAAAGFVWVVPGRG